VLLRILPIAFLIALPSGIQTPGVSEKESRTPAQQKINSQLLFEIYRLRGEAERKGVPPGPTGVKIDALGRARRSSPRLARAARLCAPPRRGDGRFHKEAAS